MVGTTGSGHPDTVVLDTGTDFRVPSVKVSPIPEIVTTTLGSGRQSSVDMDGRRVRSAIGIGMILVGSIQFGLAVADGNLLFAGFAVIFAGIGGAYLWFEGIVPE